MFEIGAKRQPVDRILRGTAGWALLLGGLLAGADRSPAALAPEAVEFFESKIRPILAQDCYECHRTGGKRKGGLVLDHRAGLLGGGESGPAVVPGKPGESLLLAAIRHENEDLEMPKAGAKLETEIIADFEKWIAMGAPDPRDEPSSEQQVAKDTDWEAVMERRKSWWSFQPVRKPEIPAGEFDHPVDRFIGAGLEETGLEASGPADRRTLIRRLSFALRGLPPTPAEVEAFLADESPDAYENLVDRYLAASEFGERWARHWMDWMRYADSHGSEGDPMIPNSWRYRDYLIRALNKDVPYDQLVREHLAGDLLESPRIEDGINQSKIGTAHLRMVFHGFAPTDALDEQVRFTDDQINVVTKSFMGLTVSCARCHDHKFDAISQKDYYALYGIFASTKPGMLAVNARDEEDAERRARMEELKEEIKAKVAAAWQESGESLKNRLRAPGDDLLAGADKVEHVLYPVRAALQGGDDGKALAKALETWEAKRSELRAHRERAYPHEWDLTRSDSGGTTQGPGARERQLPGAFVLAQEGDRVIDAIYPAGVYSHLITTKDPGVALSPRTMLDGEYEIWARVTGGGDAMIRYAVQNYPRNGTVYPVGRLKGGAWRWQKWPLDYWEGDYIHLELTTGPDQAILANGNERSWFGIRESVLVKRGGPAPPDQLLDWVEPLLDELQSPRAKDAADLADAYRSAVSKSVRAWVRGEASDGEVLLLQQLLDGGMLPNDTEGLAEVRDLLEEYRKLEAEIEVPIRAPGVWEADSFDQPLFERGNHKKPLENVSRRFLEAIDREPYETSGSGRRELAEDFLRPDNPFISRVIVNRIWHHLFGRGIVPTTDNFGRLGEKPSHPELLDYLATRFVEDGWSMKKAIRHLVTSETWRRSSVPSAKAGRVDPANKFLSHFNVQRLEAEAIRDSLLTVSGELQDDMFGSYVTGATPRRSVYLRIKRNDLDPFLKAFDAPVPVSTVGRRDVTNVPAQSLTMLNSDFVIDLAEKWASRLEGDDPRAKAEQMFERAIGRPPTSQELTSALAFIDEMEARRASAGEEKRFLEDNLREVEIKLAELAEEARERVLAVRGAPTEEAKPTGPAPIASWDFEGDAQDRIGTLHAKLQGGARIEDGALRVGEGSGFASTAPLSESLRAKTLEAWVQLDTLEQAGGGAMTVQTVNGQEFDAIVYGEKTPRHWLAGSELHDRTEAFGGAAEEEANREPVHLAITYAADGTITAYRQGQIYGSPYKPGLKQFAAGQSNILFGCRHGSPDGNRLLKGRIFEARLYDRALTAEEVAASASRDRNFVSENDLVDAMSEDERRERTELQDERIALQEDLSVLAKSGRPSNAWADYAHALFNLKEFIYVR